MANKIKDFLFPNKDNNVETQTIEINTYSMNNQEKNKEIFNSSDASQPKIVYAKKFFEVENIANDLIKGVSVIVDLSNTELIEAKRICDFLNGVIFTLNGKVSKIAKFIYLFSPSQDISLQ
ncbi:MAG: cell division protein SepF [Erysipelotrichaceae bacterium]|nr:cell division protein SepF [Erysipelotrichaceae bacterium]